MCLALPARIVSIDPAADTGVVEISGVKKEISLALVDGVQVDDYVLVHVGYALNRLSEDEARATLALFTEVGLLSEANT
jgi:hydrogenase expression/formation protein HypC